MFSGVFVGNNTGIFLINAVYFKGEWKYKFETAKTSNKPFYVDETTVKSVPMMCIEGSFKQGFIPELKSSFIELPYKVRYYKKYINITIKNLSHLICF